MTTEPPLTYSTYLHLDTLLALQIPVGPHDDADARAGGGTLLHRRPSGIRVVVRAAIAGLRCAADALNDDDTEVAVEHLLRVAAIQRLLNDQMVLLDHLPPRSFLEFRPSLGTASGSESGQFHQVQHALGLRSLDESPGLARLPGCARPRRALTSKRSIATRPAAARSIASRRRWWTSPRLNWLMAAMHVRTADRAIGDRPGTAGTSGVTYLMEALKEKAFPALWAVRTRL